MQLTAWDRVGLHPGRPTYDSRVERKVVTVLFTDVTESTQLADRLDVEELQEVMSEWFAAVREEIEAQGGTVEKYIGDAVMAVFGVPAAHEDDPARALRAALAIRRRLVELNEQLTVTHGVTMEIRTGINTGEAVAELDPAPGEAIVTGVAVNAAARLEQLADPGQTVVAERTVRAAQGFRFDELGRQDLRGTGVPVQAFLLLGEAPDAPTRGLPGTHAPLVGRERELDLLVALYDRVVAERRPQLVTIYGEPGVGKSRLTRELLERLSSLPSPPLILIGRCLSYGEGIAYWPLAEILKSLAELADDDSSAVAVERIGALVDDVLADVPGQARELTSSALAFTLGLDTGNEDFARFQPSAVRVEFDRAWRVLLSGLAARDPVVIVVDDIHWAEEVLLELLEELADRSQGPLLLVCAARPELTDTRPTWGGGRRNFSSVFLSPLPEEAAAELVGHLLDVDGLRDDVRAQILTRAEGNPFFLEEILRQLIDEGQIVRENGRWRAREELSEFELPDTVQGVLAARIDLLRPREKRTLQQASVVGRIFWRGAVAALLEGNEDVDPDLRRLEERELVATRLNSSLVGEEELAFSHVLTRDVAYESLPRRERPRAHARVARWIEETTGDRQREYSALLAHHYAQAYHGASRDRSYAQDELESIRRRAFELLLLASQHAARGAAYRSARSLAQSVLEIAATPDEQATALEELGHVCRHAALGDDAWPAYSRAVDTLRADGSTDHERIARLSGLALETVARWSGIMRNLPPEEIARDYLTTALEGLGERESEGRVRLMTAQAFWGHGYPETESPDGDPVRAEQIGSAAAEMALRIGRPDLAVVALDSVQHNLQRQLRYQAAHESAGRRLELARNAGDLGELGDSYAVAAWNAIYLGLFEEGRSLGREGFELLQADAPMYAVHALCWATLASFYLGDWDACLHDFGLVVAGLGERGQSLTTGFAVAWPAAALVHEARGDRAESQRLLDDVYDVEKSSRRRKHVSGVLSPLIVRTLLLRDEPQAARARFDATLENNPTPENLPLLQLAEAELLLAERRWDALDSLPATIRRTGDSAGTQYLDATADRIAGRVAATRGDTAAAVRLLQAAAAGYDEADMAIDAAITRLDAAEAALTAGREDEARHIAQAAAPPLRTAGFRREIKRGDALLAE
jgi:class 3 adenylate cyclase/tetratricopeptide (TPR) repeat protein